MTQEIFLPSGSILHTPSSGVTRACHMVYGLFAVGIFLHGIPSLFGIPPWAIVFYLVGGAIAYMQREDAAGSWAESHVRLLIKMFWVTVVFSIGTTVMIFGGLVGSIGAFLSGEVVTSLLLLPVIFAAIIFGIGYVLWFSYWNLKGWLRLNSGRAV